MPHKAELLSVTTESASTRVRVYHAARLLPLCAASMYMVHGARVLFIVDWETPKAGYQSSTPWELVQLIVDDQGSPR